MEYCGLLHGGGEAGKVHLLVVPVLAGRRPQALLEVPVEPLVQIEALLACLVVGNAQQLLRSLTHINAQNINLQR